MEKLPQELINMICPKLYTGHETRTAERVEAMRQLRLVNSRFYDPAARELFQDVSVGLEPERIAEFIDLCNSPVAIHVHNLRVCASPKSRQSNNNSFHQSWLEQSRDLGAAFAKLINVKCITVDCNPQPGSSEWFWVDMHIKKLITHIARGFWPRLEQLEIASGDFFVRLRSALLDSSSANYGGLPASMAKISTLKIAQDWMMTGLQQDESSLEVISEYTPRAQSLQICEFRMDDEEYQWMGLEDTGWTGNLITLQVGRSALESTSLVSLISGYTDSLQVVALHDFSLWEDSTFCELFDFLSRDSPKLRAISLDRVVYDVPPVGAKKLVSGSATQEGSFAIQMTAEDAKSFLKFLAATDCCVMFPDGQTLQQTDTAPAVRILFELKDRMKDGKYEVQESKTPWPEDAATEGQMAVLDPASQHVVRSRSHR